jgi:transposase
MKGTSYVYLYDVQVSTCFVDECEDYTTVLVKLVFFGRVEGFKMEQRAATKFSVKLKKTGNEMFVMLKSAYGEECLSRTSVSECHKRFKEGRESLQDDQRKGRPLTSTREESTEVIQKCLAEDRNLSVRILEEMTGINRETVSKMYVCLLWHTKIGIRIEN